MARYAIIGTREPGDKFYGYLMKKAGLLVEKGHEISTGGATGIDEAAMVGAASVDVSKLHVFLPWANYNKEIIPAAAHTYLYSPSTCPTWAASVDKYHPNPKNLTQGPRSLHARNYGILMYPEPVDAVIALPGVKDLGGTGQGMRIAEALGIPLLNMREKADRVKLKKMIEAM